MEKREEKKGRVIHNSNAPFNYTPASPVPMVNIISAPDTSTETHSMSPPSIYVPVPSSMSDVPRQLCSVSSSGPETPHMGVSTCVVLTIIFINYYPFSPCLL